MDTFIERNPDAASEGRLARAAALIAAGRTTEALDELDFLEQKLHFLAGADFSLQQLLDLAYALRIVALEVDGQTERAFVEGADLLRSLAPGLLPAILVEEVLSLVDEPID